jgi:uncharacterized membrane protein
MAYQSRRSFALSQLYSQAMIIALAVLNTYYPQYLSYTFLVFIVISFIISFFMLRSQFKGPSPEQLKEIRGSKKLYEEDGSEVLRLMASDAQLSQEMKPLTRASLLSMFAILITLAWYYLYFSFASNLTHDPSVAEPSKFLAFLVGYEVPYALMAVVSISQRRASKAFAQIPRNYALFESGLVGQGVVIRFPADEYEVKLDSKRKFVELVSRDEKRPARIRLYTSKPDELVELMKRRGLSSRP